MLENRNITRPQVSFKLKIDNSSRPFEPIIKYKPNARVPLRLSLARDDLGNEHYTHPYEYEIQNTLVHPNLLLPCNPIEPPPLEVTPIDQVSTPEQLTELCQHIETQSEFAVDVEHHSYRTFQGLTCLIQVSTRSRDFVIDALALRSELHRLNVSFTNPNIVKVFHGADCDILWLQRDFGVYVVNLFDTSRAAKLMKFAHLSLAYLMKHYCNVEPDKSYQLADWRERPLPLPMLQYARADTHYLLYIYDRLRNDLIAKSRNDPTGVNLLQQVYERGREVCLKRYDKPLFSDSSHLSVLRKSRSTFNARQMFAFRELYAWRDAISRELDESVGYVLPNNLMIRIAEYLPREPQGITALCKPVPPVVEKYLNDIHAIILKAINTPLDETLAPSSKILGGVDALNMIQMNPALMSIDLDAISHKRDYAHSAGLQEGANYPSLNLFGQVHLIDCSSSSFSETDLSQFKAPLQTANNPDGVQLEFSAGGYHTLTPSNQQPPSRLYNFFDSSWNKSKHRSPFNHLDKRSPL